MSKGKEALAAKNLEVKNLLATIKVMDDNIKRLVEIEKILTRENNQLKSYKDRMKIVTSATAESKRLNGQVNDLIAEVEMWKSRTIILALADQDNDQSMFSKESISVLADIDMLPKCLRANRYMKRVTKTGAKVKKQSDMVDAITAEFKSYGVKGVLKNV